VYDIVWARDPDTGRVVTYGDVRHADELQFSVYNFEMANVDYLWKHFDLFEAECQELLSGYRAIKKNETTSDETVACEKRRFPLLAAYDLCLKCSHLFNLLDSRGAISVTERVGVIARVRNLAVGVSKAYLDQQGTAAPEIAPRKQRQGAAN
jgi:glycyl-tRNA synthetase alpha chain